MCLCVSCILIACVYLVISMQPSCITAFPLWNHPGLPIEDNITNANDDNKNNNNNNDNHNNNNNDNNNDDNDNNSSNNNKNNNNHLIIVTVIE